MFTICGVSQMCNSAEISDLLSTVVKSYINFDEY